jgi:four helix bundle protein
MAVVRSYKELDVYKGAIGAAMEIFQVTQNFPPDERYSMTDQIRRSSRSVCANIAEAWRKRRYKAAFINKLSDSEAEAAETQVWIELSFRCGYIDEKVYGRLDDLYDHIIGQLVRMLENADKWTMHI